MAPTTYAQRIARNYHVTAAEIEPLLRLATAQDQILHGRAADGHPSHEGRGTR